MSKDPKKVKAGRLGGLSTARKYGPEYMAQIGRRGAIAFHKRYRLAPAGLTRFAIVRRDNGKIINYLDGDNR